MRIVFLGSGEFGVESLKWLTSSRHQILEVITQPARPAGRGRKLQPTPIAELAGKLKLHSTQAGDVNELSSVEHIHNLQPEVLLVIAFGQKIGSALLNLPGCRVINLHGSLLPKYRGAAPINWAIIKGEKQTGLTIIELNQGWDAGNILGQASTEINPMETAGELNDRLALLGPELVKDVVEKIERRTDAPLSQDDAQASRAPKLRKADAALNWDQPADQIRNFIHGMWPWPGAHCRLQQVNRNKPELISIARAEVISDQPALDDAETPGTVADDMCVICKPGRIKLLQVRPVNSKLMDFIDFINGRHLQPGDRFLNG